jgi:hypothetical protein
MLENKIIIFILFTILFVDLYDQLSNNKNTLDTNNILINKENDNKETTITINNQTFPIINKLIKPTLTSDEVPIIENIPNLNFNRTYIDLSNNNILTNNQIIIESQLPPIVSQDYIEPINTININQEQIINNSQEQITNTVNNFNSYINLYGKPYDYKENEYILWEHNNPNPWTKILYKHNAENPFYFYIKVKIPSLNDYENWKTIIPQLILNPRSGELIIPTKDEETALSLANLMISNFKGDLTLDNIINKDLIAVSIIKTMKYEIVKNKIREQIMNNLYEKPKIIDNKEIDTDLYDSKYNNYYYYNDNNKNEKFTDTGYEAYDGEEYSFIE